MFRRITRPAKSPRYRGGSFFIQDRRGKQRLRVLTQPERRSRLGGPRDEARCKTGKERSTTHLNRHWLLPSRKGPDPQAICGSGSSSCRDHELGHHAGRQVRHVVAVQHPARGLSGVKRDGDHAHRGDMHSIAQCPAQRCAVQADHLEMRGRADASDAPSWTCCGR